MAAAATDIGDLPGTMSRSTAFLAMQVAAFCTSLFRLSVPQKRCIKSPVVMISTFVS